MVEKIIENYGQFFDAIIIGVEYNLNFNYWNIDESKKEEVEITISCFNQCKDFKRELIKIKFIDVGFFRFIKYGGMSQGSLLKKENKIITFDFYPKIKSINEFGKLELEEDIDSECIVKCSELTYSIVECN